MGPPVLGLDEHPLDFRMGRLDVAFQAADRGFDVGAGDAVGAGVGAMVLASFGVGAVVDADVDAAVVAGYEVSAMPSALVMAGIWSSGLYRARKSSRARRRRRGG